jgi:hypothetical protein
MVGRLAGWSAVVTLVYHTLKVSLYTSTGLTEWSLLSPLVPALICKCPPQMRTLRAYPHFARLGCRMHAYSRFHAASCGRKSPLELAAAIALCQRPSVCVWGPARL